MSDRQVSVTWKRVALILMSIFIAWAGYDRNQVDKRADRAEQRMDKIEETIRVSPTKSDIQELRSAIKELSDRMYYEAREETPRRSAWLPKQGTPTP